MAAEESAVGDSFARTGGSGTDRVGARRGKKIMVWTVKDRERVMELAAWGVDAMLSDETEMLVRSLRSPSDGRGN